MKDAWTPGFLASAALTPSPRRTNKQTSNESGHCSGVGGGGQARKSAILSLEIDTRGQKTIRAITLSWPTLMVRQTFDEAESL